SLFVAIPKHLGHPVHSLARGERRVLMGRFLGYAFGILFILYFLANGAFMLFSPRAWFKYMRWTGGTGSFTVEQHTSGWGALYVRLMGATFLGVVGWVLYDMLFQH